MLLEVLFSIHTWTFAIIFTSVYVLRSGRRPVFPIVNSHLIDPFSSKANREYSTNAATLITKGLAKHQGPITLAITNGRKIVLPSSLTNWVKSNKDLDHRELVRQDFYSDFPGFEGLTLLHSGDMLMDVIKTKLGQNDSLMPIMNKSAVKALEVHWGNDKVWHAIDWQKDTTGIIARVASSVFVGPEKSDDAQWLDVVQGYVAAYFSAVNELHGYPAWSRPMVQRFLPNATACRKYVVQARDIMNEVLVKRRQEVEKANLEGRSPPRYNDALAWTQAASGGTMEAGDVQLSLAMAALFTTSELFRQVLIDLAEHPQLVEPLREEISQQISTHGVSVAATSAMVLLDSIMKESQRRSAPLVGLERVVLKDVVLPSGQRIPTGSHVVVDSTNLWDLAVYPDPGRFDGYRFLRKREAGDKTSQFVQSGSEFSVFGGGRHLCPGRFFASNELKLVVAHILLKYDIQLAEGYEVRSLQLGVYKVVDPMAKLEVKRRDAVDVDMPL
ncbi:hypothetical protein AA0120_g1530 [Alternaria tenuissima]|nr:hypothetical protein AA0120_g1530 [Alternaria tenuissima]